MLKNKVILFLVFSSFFCLTGRTPENVKNFEGKVLEKEIDFDGKERKYRIYLPKDYVFTRKYPLILSSSWDLPRQTAAGLHEITDHLPCSQTC